MSLSENSLDFNVMNMISCFFAGASKFPKSLVHAPGVCALLKKLFDTETDKGKNKNETEKKKNHTFVN